MTINVKGKDIQISDALIKEYGGPCPVTQDEIECVAESCRFTEDATVEEMEKELAGAIQECIDIREATPAIIREAGLIQMEKNILPDLSDQSITLMQEARTQLYTTGKTDVMCPKCRTHPKTWESQNGERTFISCECGYVRGCEINF